MKSLKKHFLAIFILLSPALLFAEQQSGPDNNASPPLPLGELRNFVQAFEQIRRSYVEEIDDQTLLENAIEGLLAKLDPHSAYLNEDDFSDLQDQSTGTFGGLGIEIIMEDGLIRVVSPIDDSPAQQAGIRAGDLISAIDDQLVSGLTLREAVNKLRGEKGTSVRLTILRKSSEAPMEFTLTRDIIESKSVRSRFLEPGYGYVRISQFQENTGGQFATALTALTKEEPLKGLILDLRNNPGGVLDASLKVVDALIAEGLIVYTEGRSKEAQAKYRASSRTLVGQTPMIVLINGGSASASEIVAGALQDHHRAIIVGTRSFGKGSVQTVIPLDENRAIKLTTARYFTPAGRSIQAEGIEPDIVIRPAHIEEFDESGRIKEKNLVGHLKNSDKNEAATATESETLEDNQLQGALNLLKGINLAKADKTVQE